MSVFICEKCGCLDNTALHNNYWMVIGNKHGFGVRFKDTYYNDHACCQWCCLGVEFEDGSGKIGTEDTLDLTMPVTHWTEIGEARLLELEKRDDGSMINAKSFLHNYHGRICGCDHQCETCESNLVCNPKISKEPKIKFIEKEK